MATKTETKLKAEEKPRAPDYRDMDSVPKDGRHIYLTADGQNETEALWHKTRKFVPGKGWLPDEWWKASLTGEKITWEPLGWRPLNG